MYLIIDLYFIIEIKNSEANFYTNSRYFILFFPHRILLKFKPLFRCAGLNNWLQSALSSGRVHFPVCLIQILNCINLHIDCSISVQLLLQHVKLNSTESVLSLYKRDLPLQIGALQSETYTRLSCTVLQSSHVDAFRIYAAQFRIFFILALKLLNQPLKNFVNDLPLRDLWLHPASFKKRDVIHKSIRLKTNGRFLFRRSYACVKITWGIQLTETDVAGQTHVNMSDVFLTVPRFQSIPLSNPSC
jgi:hypothetical protein